MSSDSVITNVEAAIARGASADELMQIIVAGFDGQSGTIHRIDDAGMLSLVAQIGVPESIMDKVVKIPIGKGIAGHAAAERRPVTICNIQTDTSGVARPSAKVTGMEGAIAVPMLVDGELFGTLGVGKNREYTWSDAEVNEIEQVATLLGKLFQR